MVMLVTVSMQRSRLLGQGGHGSIVVEASHEGQRSAGMSRPFE